MIADKRPRDTGENAQPERRGVSNRTAIEEAKAQVSCLDLAERLCGPGQLRRTGDRWVARCPLPNHADRTPSFAVYPETDSFYCYGCHVGGDVVDLASAAWGYPKDDVRMAATDLLREFGYEWEGWSDKRRDRFARQTPVRDELDRSKARMVQRRLYRWFYAPRIVGLVDEDERMKETHIAWAECEMLARLLLEGR